MPTNPPQPAHIRPATPSDIPDILALIKELADYEKMSDLVVATEELLHTELFGPNPAAEVLIASTENQTVGMALFFHNMSTFLGRRGIYLEDLYVKPEFRDRGIGKLLLTSLAKLAVQRNCGRLEWSVLDWNQPAIDFYQSIGAEHMNEWHLYRLTGKSLQKLGNTH